MKCTALINFLFCYRRPVRKMSNSHKKAKLKKVLQERLRLVLFNMNCNILKTFFDSTSVEYLLDNFIFHLSTQACGVKTTNNDYDF